MSWKQLQEQGWQHFHREEFLQARECWKQEAAILEHDASSDSLDVFATTLHNLGLVHDELKCFDHAIDLYEKSLSRIKQQRAPDSLRLAERYSELGSIYFRRHRFHRFDVAQQYLHLALSIQEKQAPNSLALANTCHNLGLVYEKRSCFKDSVSYFKRAVAIRNDKAPSDSLYLLLGTTYYELGRVYDDQNIFDKATYYYEMAMAIKEQVEPNSLALAQVYHNLGCVYTVKNRLDEAQHCLENALSIQHQRKLSPRDLTMTKHNLWRVVAKQKKLIESGKEKETDANMVYAKSKSVRRQPPSNPNAAEIEDDLCCGSLTKLPNYAKTNVAAFLGARDALNLALSSKTLLHVLSVLYVPPGLIFESLIKWKENGDTGHVPRKFRRIPLLFPTRVRSVAMSLEWKDQGFGDRQGQIFVIAASLHETQQQQRSDASHVVAKYDQNPQQDLFEGGLVVYESPLASHTFERLHFTFRPKPDKALYLWYKVGHGGGHELAVRNVRLKVPATNLHEACQLGNINEVELVLRKGANANATDADGLTPLHDAIQTGNDDIVKLLLKYGAQPNSPANDGLTPLHEACEAGHKLIVGILLAENTLPSPQKKNGRTPLHEACRNGHDSVVALMIKHEADPNAIDRDGLTPLDLAERNGCKSTVQLLSQLGAKPTESLDVLESDRIATNRDGLKEGCTSANEESASLPTKYEPEAITGTRAVSTSPHASAENGVLPISDVPMASRAYNNGGLHPSDAPPATQSTASLVGTGKSQRHPSNAALPDTASVNEDGLRRIPLDQGTSSVLTIPTNELITTFISGISNWLTWTAEALGRALPQPVTAVDKVLQQLADDAEPPYTLYIGTLDAMCDNLVAEALESGTSVMKITHAMFACEESRTWLHNFLLERHQMSEALISKIIDVFYGGITMENGLHAGTGALLTIAKLHLQDESGVSDESSLDLEEYNQVNEFPGNLLRLKELIKQLVNLGCDELIASKLIGAVCVDGIPRDPEVFDSLIKCFKTVSSFRTHLHVAITHFQSHSGGKRLLGSKSELLHGELRFRVERSLYDQAKLFCETDCRIPLAPFTAEFVRLDAKETIMVLIETLIQKAKNGDVPGSQFDARGAAVLSMLNGRKAISSGVSKYLPTQYYFQNDCHTKGLCIPFCNLILFVSTNLLMIPSQVQHLVSSEYETNTLNNWVALRAAFEFDIHKGCKGDFRYDTPAFKRADDLIKRSVEEFIRDTDFRFSEVFMASGQTILVSSVRVLCDKIATRCEASSAWLVREMISRYMLGLK